MRTQWEACGTIAYFTIAYLFVFVGQGIFSLIMNASSLYVLLYSTGEDGNLVYTDFIGLFIFVMGLAIEVNADTVLKKHLASPEPGTGKFIKSGIWRYSRHPNYFGESMLWWGIFCIACGQKYGWVTIYGTLFMSFLLRFVSGVPFPERKYKENPEWQQYCRETNVFCPWFAKLDKAVT